MSGLLIPDDWDEGTDGFCTLSFTVPKSPLWTANVIGQVLALSEPKMWDEVTGDAEQAAIVGQDIFNSYSVDCP